MSTIKIGSSANQKGITVNPSVVLFNGSNVKKIMKGTVTIWENIKALVPTMTSNTAPYGEVSAISYDSAGYPWKAFDGDTSTSWISSGPLSTAWIQYKFNTAYCVKKVSITNRADRAIYTLKTFNVQGSNDGSSWTSLTDTLTSPDQSAGAVNEFNINNTNRYLYYRINALTVNNSYLEIAEIQFYGN